MASAAITCCCIILPGSDAGFGPERRPPTAVATNPRAALQVQLQAQVVPSSLTPRAATQKEAGVPVGPRAAAGARADHPAKAAGAAATRASCRAC
jgi:hypothetical protein